MSVFYWTYAVYQPYWRFIILKIKFCCYRFLLSRNENHNKHKWNWRGKKNVRQINTSSRGHIVSVAPSRSIISNKITVVTDFIAYVRGKAVVEFRFNHLDIYIDLWNFFFLAFHRQINGLLVALHCPIVITYRISVRFFFLDLKCWEQIEINIERGC